MRIGAVALLALVLAGTVSAAGAKTRIQHFDPFVNGKLARGFEVQQTLRGTCGSGSSATLRSDAWRCFAGNAVLDPCFENPAAKWLACPVGDLSLNGMAKLNLTQPLPRALANKGKPGTGHPWLLYLTNGKTCSFLTGATFLYQGKRVNYGCDTNTFLAGLPNRSTPTWTITLGTGPKSKPKQVGIEVATW